MVVEDIVTQRNAIAQSGAAILLVEQNLEVCSQLAERRCIVEQGLTVDTADHAAFVADAAAKDRALGIGLGLV